MTEFRQQILEFFEQDPDSEGAAWDKPSERAEQESWGISRASQMIGFVTAISMDVTQQCRRRR
ncbi:unnamed protein product [Cylicocyclus nassatus]|uniref:Uncharacterized protein n=1 Tax=Cylicocyclus nassatus TaxID=53992 RepID=A0AA36HHM2_CYLNA|nr:unnamed protein product [Cylicocyclus nassatus]